MLIFESELQGNAVHVLCYLNLRFARSHWRVSVLDRLGRGDVDGVRRPLLNVLANKFMVDIIKNPMVHEMLPDFANDIVVARHDGVRHEIIRVKHLVD